MTISDGLPKRHVSLSNPLFVALVRSLRPGERLNSEDHGLNLVLYTVNDHSPMALIFSPEHPESALEALR